MDRPAVQVAVVMEREAHPNRWEEWRHRVAEVVLHEAAFGDAPRPLREGGKLALWLYPGFELQLYADEAEGYYLNLSSGSPVWFVMWRLSEDDPTHAVPEAVSLSYNEAGRWLDAQEHVDNVPLDPELCAWLQAFTDAHYQPQPKQRQRPASFQTPRNRH